MKSIELIKEHQDKLKEMIKSLFSNEFYIFNFQELKDERHCDLHMPDIIYVVTGDLYDENSKHIHWFEFCLTWLNDKLFSDMNRSMFLFNTFLYWEKVSLGKDTGDFLLHPIDVLYKEFEKLK